MNLLFSLYIFIIIIAVIFIKDLIVKFNDKKQNILTYWITLLVTALIIVVCVYLLQKFVVEKFHFEVSPPRKLGMQEHVLPLIKPGENPGYMNNAQSVDYPIQGSGISCSKAYIGHEGNLNMNIGEWKRGNGEGIPARPDIYLKGNATQVPFAANCDTCEVNTGTFEIENPDKPCPSPYFENTDKKIQENYEGEKVVMYYSDSCGFCNKAKDILKDVMDHIELRNTKDHPLPNGVNGVPHFEYKGKSHTGCPSSADDLFAKLEMVQEKYEGDKIVMYYSDSCGFCNKAKDILKDVMDHIELRNTKDHPLPNGVNGVPHFEYKGKSHTGCPSSADELFAKLEMVQENYELNCDNLSELDIVMYSRDGCPFCDKAKNLLGNCISKITVKNNEGTPEGVNGVPHFESRATGKNHTGCPSSIEELIIKLKGNTQENYQPKPYNSQYFDYNNYIAPYEKSVVDTLSCYSGGCPLKNKSGKVGVPFV